MAVFVCVFFLKVFVEFTRVASKDLEQDFVESLDRHIPRFLEIFKSKKGIVGKTLAEILAQVEMKVSHFWMCEGFYVCDPVTSLRLSISLSVPTNYKHELL